MNAQTEITGQENIIDSRDIIARQEYLESFLIDSYNDTQEDDESHVSSIDDLEEWAEEIFNNEFEEYKALTDLILDCEGYGDWDYGATLISREYFVEYIKELIDDCYEMPKELNSGKWPYRHMVMDYEAAAAEAEQDYQEVTLFGYEFLIRA